MHTSRTVSKTGATIEDVILVDVWDKEVLLVIAEDLEEAVETYSNGEFEYDDERALTMTGLEHPFTIILSRNNVSIGDITHECVHVGRGMLTLVGVKDSSPLDEALAYTVEAIQRAVIGICKQNNIEIGI